MKRPKLCTTRESWCPVVLLGLLYESFPEALAAENPENLKLASKAEEAIVDCLEELVGVQKIRELYKQGPFRQKLAQDSLKKAGDEVSKLRGKLTQYAKEMTHSSAMNYVEASIRFFDLFQRGLDAKAEWTERDEKNLTEGYDAMEKRATTLREKRAGKG